MCLLDTHGTLHASPENAFKNFTRYNAMVRTKNSEPQMHLFAPEVSLSIM